MFHPLAEAFDPSVVYRHRPDIGQGSSNDVKSGTNSPKSKKETKLLFIAMHRSQSEILFYLLKLLQIQQFSALVQG